MFAPLLVLQSLLLFGCGSPVNEQAGDSGAVNPGTLGNRAPNIAGTPPASVNVGDSYVFVPNASDADGDPLTFSIQGLPDWATFDTTSGELSGVPSGADLGLYSNIQITVSDGKTTNSLPMFSINAVAVSLGSVTLSWTPPTFNEDGSTLTDLAAYKIYYGVSQGNYTNQIRIDNASVSTYVVENLAPNTYYFVSTAINSAGVESRYSNVATKVVM